MQPLVETSKSTTLVTPPAMDERLDFITIKSPRGNRAATAQEAAAIEALADVLDDQPPSRPMAAFFNAAETLRAPSMKVRTRTVTKAVMPSPLLQKAIAAQKDIKIIEVLHSGSAGTPGAVSPAYERVETLTVVAKGQAVKKPVAAGLPTYKTTYPVTRRVFRNGPSPKDAISAAASSVVAQTPPAEAAVLVKSVVSIEPMPFGVATLRLFCY